METATRRAVSSRYILSQSTFRQEKSATSVLPVRDAGLVMRNARPRDVRCCFSVPHTPHGTRAKAHGAGVWGAHSNPRAGATRKCSS